MIAKIVQTIVSIGKSENSVTTPMITAPSVAPTSGIRSSRKMITASGSAYGTLRISSMIQLVTPAIVACTSAPAT